MNSFSHTNSHTTLGPPVYVQISYTQQLRKCSHVVSTAFPDHEKVQKKYLKPLQLAKVNEVLHYNSCQFRL